MEKSFAGGTSSTVLINPTPRTGRPGVYHNALKRSHGLCGTTAQHCLGSSVAVISYVCLESDESRQGTKAARLALAGRSTYSFNRVISWTGHQATRNATKRVCDLNATGSHHGTQNLSLRDKVMIQQQVHLQLPCYDFCPVQATAITFVLLPTETPRGDGQRSRIFSKWLSSRQRRAVCTKGRDVINAS
jgi:hypothetical protein